jgi:type IV pilus assembly protein PilC
MPTFAYTGKTIGGEVRKGNIDAQTLAQATAALRRQQIVPSSITEKKGGLGAIELKIPGLGGRVKTKELVIFTRQFATMIDAGLPLVQCLDILASQQENKERFDLCRRTEKTPEGLRQSVCEPGCRR